MRPATSSNHWVESTFGEGMATEQARNCHCATAECPITIDSFHRVFRTARHVTTRRRKQWRHCPLVPTQQLNDCKFNGVFHPSVADPLDFNARDVFSIGSYDYVVFCCTTANAFSTSFNNSSNSTFNNDFLGLMTTSAAILFCGRRRRTASRSRRFMRLRSTAPPNARLTVNPTRKSSSASRRI